MKKYNKFLEYRITADANPVLQT